MTSDSRGFLFQDDSEDFPFDPALRIPPLQAASPYISSRLPPLVKPLEPAARQNDEEQSTLTARSRALANAQPLASDSPARPYGGMGPPARQSDLRPDRSPRKRRRNEYVQLPKLNAGAVGQEVRQLNRVPILNEIREPQHGPSRFPPMVNDRKAVQVADILNERDSNSQIEGPQVSEANASKSTNVLNVGRMQTKTDPQELDPGQKKRIYTRGRRHWTDGETECLLKGVGIYGVGKWKKILEHEDFNFLEGRTTVDLKDRYRTCRMREDALITEKAAAVAAKAAQDEMDKATPIKIETQEMTFASILTTSTVTDLLRARRNTPSKGTTPSTEQDDINIARGFQQYGFNWSAISKDPVFALSHRTANSIRDRFRLKYPLHYQSSVPLPLPDLDYKPPRRWRQIKKMHALHRKLGEPCKCVGMDVNGEMQKSPERRLPRTRSSKRLNKKHSEQGPVMDSKLWEQVALGVNGPSELKKLDGEPSDAKKTCSIANIVKPTLPSIQGVCGKFDIQPLPEYGNNEDEDYEDLGSSEFESGVESDYSSLAEFDGLEYQGASGNLDEVLSGEPRGAMDSHASLGIPSLLNDVPPEEGRLPSFKEAYSDWGEGNGTGGPTLPPLLWEDLAPRPMFDLE